MVKTKFCVFLKLALFLSLLTAASQNALIGKDAGISPEELVAKHLKAFGDPGILAAVQSRVFVGSSSVRFVQGATGSMSGTSLYVSEGKKLGLTMKFADKDYPGEYFAFDGKEVSVGHINPGQKSPIADFLFRNGRIIKDGFIGGALSVNWPLLNIQERRPILKCQIKEIEGKELYELDYQPRDGFGDMKIKMFFDMETFNHVRTEYSVRVRDDVTATQSYTPEVITSSSSSSSSSATLNKTSSTLFGSTPESIYKLVEKFGDFKKVSGMMLPHSYSIDYEVEGQGHAFIGHWDMVAKQWIVNKAWDPLFFKAQK